MKALVMSDSHGWDAEVKKIVDRHRYEVDALFHCGDSELSASSSALNEVYTVRGNCDFGTDFPEECVEDVADMRFFVAHGHLLNVKTSEMNLIYKGMETESQIICYGHTHVPLAIQEKNMVILNPGSMRLPRQYPKGTYVIVETKENEIEVNFYDLDGNKLADLSKNFHINC
ncbi:YfcE family phosphodiesterase [Salipaludibacillus keqinensis]|uniref:Phosphoesterase n=1 Tax=Salipaludibacillus keqinensis TaxID=2045207 RepID=A0A323TE46_9BACI|nr:metallophosphoesterase [Salipaludibacillus keqinensis]PYZ93672.1 YfcE family phosphodiesterase [Salipaludibacillus keqinensis]